MSDQRDPMHSTEAPLIADHLALDLLNTQARDGVVQVDFWRSGDDVARWLAACGIDPGPLASQAEKDALLEAAVALRAIARELLARRRLGELADPAPLNRYLEALQAAPVLAWDREGPRMARRLPAASPRRALGEVAEAVAELLATGQFEYVRQCEHPDCVLWFYDRTKSHRRRWCSMALCGNRHKAAQFRKRSRTEG